MMGSGVRVEDDDAIAEYMVSLLTDEKARTADRLEASKWLADRAFGRSVQTMDLDITARPAIDVAKLSMKDLEALVAKLEKYART